MIVEGSGIHLCSGSRYKIPTDIYIFREMIPTPLLKKDINPTPRIASEDTGTLLRRLPALTSV